MTRARLTAGPDVCSYAKIRSTVWWNKSKSLGPIVEQGTHLGQSPLWQP